MEIATLKLFVETARLGSFAKVARAVDVDPATVSRVVAGLEAELGFRLFQRTTRRMQLTPAGLDYLQAVEGAVDQLESAREVALMQDKGLTGTLRVTASYAMGQIKLVPLLAEFRKTFPNLRVELIFTDANLDLVAERIDLAIRLSPRIEGNYIAAKLFQTRYHVVASPPYLRKHPVGKDPSALAQHHCLTLDITDFRKQWQFCNQAGEISRVKIHSDVMVSHAVALADLAIAGVGPALLPHWVIAKDIRGGRLLDLFPNYRATATTFDTGAWLLYPSRAFLPRRVRMAVDFFKARLAGGSAKEINIPVED